MMSNTTAGLIVGVLPMFIVLATIAALIFFARKGRAVREAEEARLAEQARQAATPIRGKFGQRFREWPFGVARQK
jgi:hypothetical protein